MIGYKVVFMKNGRYFSYGVIKWQVEYFINKKVFPKIGKLFVFKTFDDALRFISERVIFDFDNVKIFKCEYRKSVIQRKYRVKFNYYNDKMFELFWENYKAFKRRGEGVEVPKGTVFADWVKLIKEE